MHPLECEVVPCDIQGKFFDDSGRIALLPNGLVSRNPVIENDAVFSVLQFGAIIPPLSPWKGVHRFMPGYKYQGTKMVGPIAMPKHNEISTLNSEQQADFIERRLDAILKKHIGEHDPVVLFSGGVDSGIIASRLAALGYRNSLLINFSFGEEDSESKLAEEMSIKLGLKFERVFGKDRPCTCLDDPGKIYCQPFGDHSTVPTSDLARSVVKYLSNEKRLIIDGTGADGAFGMAAKVKAWKQVCRVPRIARKAASLAYGQMLWHRKDRIESVARILRRSIEMPMLSAILAQNPLAGTFYSNASRFSVDDRLKTWIEGWAGELLPTQIVAADLALTCANIFAQKSRPILESAGHKVLYPFLETEMVSTALAVMPHWQMDEPKAPLKKSLARHVPHNMVYRAKSGFVDPKREIFFNAEFIDHLRTAAGPTSPIAHMLEQKPLLKACELLAQKRTLPPQTLNLIWAVVFIDRWYRTSGIQFS